MANAFFSDLLSTISERGRTLLRRGASSDSRQDASELLELCEALLSGRGEASGTAMAGSTGRRAAPATWYRCAPTCFR
jgi:malonyl-CoA decarboxylase